MADMSKYPRNSVELRSHESVMAEDQTKPLTLAKKSLTQTKSVAVVLAVCALLVIGVLGLGALQVSNKYSTYIDYGWNGLYDDDYCRRESVVGVGVFCDAANTESILAITCPPDVACPMGVSISADLLASGDAKKGCRCKCVDTRKIARRRRRSVQPDVGIGGSCQRRRHPEDRRC